jgi:Ni/Fe-hydrogenase subunit HybB-like protein
MTLESAPGSVGYSPQEQLKAPPWHGLVAWDMLCNGLTTGLFLVAALGELVMPAVFLPVVRVAYPVALLLLVADQVLLILDLGDPWRFHHMMRVFKPQSPMSVGVWSLNAYAGVLTVVVVLFLLPDGGALEWARPTAVVLGLGPAFASAVYKGVLMSTSAQPGWRDARWLGGYHCSGAAVLGCAEIVVLAYLTGYPRAAEVLQPALIVLLLVHAVPLVLVGAELWPALSRGFTRGQRALAVALVLIGGWLLPLSLVSVGGAAAMVTAAVLIVVGNLAARFILVRLPHQSASAPGHH